MRGRDPPPPAPPPPPTHTFLKVSHPVVSKKGHKKRALKVPEIFFWGGEGAALKGSIRMAVRQRRRGWYPPAPPPPGPPPPSKPK